MILAREPVWFSGLGTVQKSRNCECCFRNEASTVTLAESLSLSPRQKVMVNQFQKPCQVTRGLMGLDYLKGFYYLNFTLRSRNLSILQSDQPIFYAISPFISFPTNVADLFVCMHTRMPSNHVDFWQMPRHVPATLWVRFQKCFFF